MAVKLSVLARDHLGVVEGEPTTFPGGAAIRTELRGAVLVEDQPARALGRALVWARQHQLEELHLLVEDCAGQLTRQATGFELPTTVWWVRDRELHAVQPEPLPVPPPAPDAALAYAAAIEAAGATVVVEHGVVTGEVLGLEVARVVAHLERDGVDAVALEVGIGRHDREAFAIIHGDRPTSAALEGVVRSVRQTRNAAAPEQPLYRIAQERWLREVVLARPDLVGARSLDRHEGPLARPNVRDPWPAVATGTAVDGEPIVVVCSVGVDPDLVPFAADARAMVEPAARLVLVLPERDALGFARSLAASMAVPAQIVTVPATWRELA